MSGASGTVRRATVRFAALVGVILVCTACSGNSDTPLVSAGDSFTVDAFSGRENPQFALSHADADALNLALKECAEPVASSPPADGGLGFRGFVIMGTGQVFVFKDGQTWITSGGSIRTCHSDVVFSAAFDIAKPHVDNLAEIVGSD